MTCYLSEKSLCFHLPKSRKLAIYILSDLIKSVLTHILKLSVNCFPLIFDITLSLDFSLRCAGELKKKFCLEKVINVELKS